MNTFLSTAQETQKEQYQAFAQAVVAPIAEKLVNHEVCLKEFMQQLGQSGYLGINVPKEYGGQSGTFLDLILFIEQIARYEPGLGLTLGNHAAFIELVKRYGTNQQKSRYLPSLARGESIATLAFSEANAGTDFEAVQSTVSDGVLNGKKRLIVTGDFASVFAVLARDSDKLVLLLVERPQAEAFKLGPERRLMGLRSAYVNDIEFIAVKVEQDNRIVSGAGTTAMALYAMSVSKVVLSAAAIGMMDAACDMALQHARERRQFGVNIGTFQGVQWKIADMSVDAAGSRLQLYRAAWAHDEDLEHFERYAAMCKLLSSRSARLHSGEALQIMASEGILEDGVMARFYDDAKVMEIAQGTSEFQKMLLTKELGI